MILIAIIFWFVVLAAAFGLIVGLCQIIRDWWKGDKTGGSLPGPFR
ncbi:MAG TPA: hypothetical protein PKW49_03305 [Paludibacteraceae bacterium]|nr:hypothetical protein [Paludibacteraceae bacterium]